MSVRLCAGAPFSAASKREHVGNLLNVLRLFGNVARTANPLFTSKDYHSFKHLIMMAAVLLDIHKSILRMLAKGESLQTTTAMLCSAVEEAKAGVICTIMSVDRVGLLHPMTAPNMPREFAAGFEGVLFGPALGRVVRPPT